MEYKDLDEQSLARCCREGDILAEDELYRRYAPKVYTLCRRYLNDGNEAKDMVQDSLIQALDKIHTFSFTGNGSLYNWIRRIAVNKAINHLKRNRWRFVPLEYWQGDSFIIEDSDEPNFEELEDIEEEIKIEDLENLEVPEGVSIDDPVRLYLKEIGKISLLTLEEEMALSKRIVDILFYLPNS